MYGTSDVGLQGWTEADFMQDIRDTHNITGIYGGAVTWQSPLQPTIASSTYEAEYMAASAGCHEALWLRKVLRDIGHAPSSSAVLYGGNKVALALSHNVKMIPVVTAKRKGRRKAEEKRRKENNNIMT